MCMPFLNWLVEPCSATAAECSGGNDSLDTDEILGKAREDLGRAVAHDDEILDPDPAEAVQVDPRLDRDDVARLEHPLRRLGKPRVLPERGAGAVAAALA